MLTMLTADHSSTNGRWAQGAAWCLIVGPWVYPFAGGPSPVAEPWLATGVLAAGLILLLAARQKLWETLPQIVAQAWVAAAALNAGIALVQYLGFSSEFGPWLPMASSGQAYGVLRQRNQFATLTLIGLAALLPALMGARSLCRVLPWALLLAVGNAASASRIGALGVLALGLCPLCWPVLRTKRFLLLFLTVAVGYLLAVFMLPLLLQHLQQVRTETVFDRIASDAGCGSRIVLWTNVLHLIAMKPWAGWGWGELDYAHFMTLYGGPRFCDILDNAHNLPLHIAVELGVPVAAAATFGVAALLAKTFDRREAQPHRLMAWLVLIFVLMHSLVEYPLWYGPFFVALAISVCMLRRQSPQTLRVAPAVPATIAASGLLILVFVWADYRLISQAYLPASARHKGYRDVAVADLKPMFFTDQWRFAELTTTTLQASNALHTYHLSRAVLHYSPEPIVVERLMESLLLLGHEEEAAYYLQRYQAAFPEQARTWQESSAARRAP